MAGTPHDDLLVVLLDLDKAGITDEVMGRSLSALTGRGWPLEDSIDAWQQAIGFCSIRYNAWSQPRLTMSGRANAIAIKETRTRALSEARRVAERSNKESRL
jgi:hypothetical protein